MKASRRKIVELWQRAQEALRATQTLMAAGFPDFAAAAVSSLRAPRSITGGKVIEGVIGEKLFGLRSSDKGSIARNKGEGKLVVSEEPMGT